MPLGAALRVSEIRSRRLFETVKDEAFLAVEFISKVDPVNGKRLVQCNIRDIIYNAASGSAVPVAMVVVTGRLILRVEDHQRGARF
jgi:hypothetical protein